MTEKKKIAVFSLGWCSDIFYEYLKGMREGFRNTQTDIYVFMCYPIVGDDERFISGELNIFELPNLLDFDGVGIFANSMEFNNIFENLRDKCLRAGVPTVVTGHTCEECFTVLSDNYSGTLELCKHLKEVHHTDDFVYIAGSPDNLDSNERKRAIEDFLKSEGKELDEEHFFYSNWDFFSTANFIENWLKSDKPLPGAFICANDTLAMVSCDVLRRNNVKVPEDVIVTGFDNEYMAKISDPSIASVNQRFDKVGKKTAETILGVIDGESPEHSQIVNSEYVPSESCGCFDAADFDGMRRELGRMEFMVYSSDTSMNKRMSSLEQGILSVPNFDSLSGYLKEFYRGMTAFENNSFYIVLDPRCRTVVKNPDKDLRTKGYSNKMEAVLIKEQSVVHDGKLFSRNELVPGLEPSAENRLFVFLPLHEHERTMGYVIFCDDNEKVKESNGSRRYVDRLSIIIGRFLQKLSRDVLYNKVMELSETDALTHVKNRAAYEKREKTIDEELAVVNKEFGLAIFDINNLKKVNDEFGHDDGDKYLVNCCTLICQTFKHSAVFRFGGDEFVVLLMNADYKNREKLFSDMNAQMEELQDKDIPLYEKVSVAGGIAVFTPGMDQKVADVFVRADKFMYERKAVMKEKMKK